MTLSFFGPGLIRAFASASRSAPSDSLSSSAAAISSDTARGDSASGSLTIDDERRVCGGAGGVTDCTGTQ